MTIGKVHLTENYARYRLREPSEFVKSSLRTHDIGRKGHSKRIAGKLKRSGKWATQAVLIARPDYAKGLRLTKKGKGWKLESVRHSLAAKGIKTGRKKTKHMRADVWLEKQGYAVKPDRFWTESRVRTSD